MSVFFFQAEDGIRDWSVTGVQTCALPIFRLVVGDENGRVVAVPRRLTVPDRALQGRKRGEQFGPTIQVRQPFLRSDGAAIGGAQWGRRDACPTRLSGLGWLVRKAHGEDGAFAFLA